MEIKDEAVQILEKPKREKKVSKLMQVESMTFYDPNMSLKKVFASVEEQSDQQDKNQLKKAHKKHKLKKPVKVKAKMTKKQQK